MNGKYIKSRFGSKSAKLPKQEKYSNGFVMICVYSFVYSVSICIVGMNRLSFSPFAWKKCPIKIHRNLPKLTSLNNIPNQVLFAFKHKLATCFFLFHPYISWKVLSPSLAIIKFPIPCLLVFYVYHFLFWKCLLSV